VPKAGVKDGLQEFQIKNVRGGGGCQERKTMKGEKIPEAGYKGPGKGPSD